jgi:alpha-D-xyloside xylohydrolase
MVWGRSTYAGGQRHAAQWSGDPNCTYNALASTLRSGLSIGLCGHAFWSHDIGGFHRQPTPELYVRWAQFGLLSPLSRAHGMTTRLPWAYGEEPLRIFRDYTRLRYRLLPYIYTYASIASETSLPIMRPMLLEFPTDSCAHEVDLQYMLGSELLVAPIYNSQGRRPVYLPSGRWVDYWTREVIEGPRMLHVEATLDTLPLYVRADALVPTTEPQDDLTEDPFEMVTFDCYLLDEGTFELRDTDGVTRVEASFEGTQLEIALEGAKERIGLHLIPLPDSPHVETVRVNGLDLEAVESLELNLESGAGWTSDPDGGLRILVNEG